MCLCRRQRAEREKFRDGFATVWMYVALFCVFEWLPKILYGGNSLKKDTVSVVLAPN